MPFIRPVSDLRNHFSEIIKETEATTQPIYLTKNGYASLVVMSVDAYEKGLFERETYLKLKEAEVQAKSSNVRVSHSELERLVAGELGDEDK